MPSACGTTFVEKAFHKKKKRPGNRWRLDETYIKVKGQWKYFYRAVDKQGNTIDFLLTTKRDKKAALRFLTKAIARNGKPGLINIDKSGANTAGFELIHMLKKGQMRTTRGKRLSPVEQFYGLAA